MEAERAPIREPGPSPGSRRQAVHYESSAPASGDGSNL
jgi:hypothetical protein